MKNEKRNEKVNVNSDNFIYSEVLSTTWFDDSHFRSFIWAFLYLYKHSQIHIQCVSLQIEFHVLTKKAYLQYSFSVFLHFCNVVYRIDKIDERK